MIPLKNKLSYWWEKANRADVLYSNIYAERLKMQYEYVYLRGGYSRDSTKYHWIKAVPVNDKPGTYSVTRQYNRVTDGERDFYNYWPSREMSREAALKEIQIFEEHWKNSGFQKIDNSPFKEKTLTKPALTPESQ